MACDRTPGSILLVDDEGSFRDSLAEMLRDDGHEVLAYPDPGALPPLHTLSGVDLLLTDYDMPKTNGLTLADRFHACHPRVPVLLVSSSTLPVAPYQYNVTPDAFFFTRWPSPS